MELETGEIQFGNFTLEPVRRRLRRGQEVLQVGGKAFDLLVYLVTNSGRPIEKAELLKAVWPDSFVEEGNLSHNVFLLRKVLGSGPDGPILTLPGRGYLFTLPVTTGGDRPTVSHRLPVMQTLEATHMRVVLEEETEEHIAPWRSPWVLSLACVGVGLLGVAGWYGWQHYQDRTAGPPVQVVLADPEGTTGDPILDHTLVDALRMDLAQSPFVTVASPSLVRTTLTQMLHKPDDRLTEPLARDVCERTGSQVVLRGSIVRTGGHYLLLEQGTSCADGNIVASRKVETSTADDLPPTLDRLAAQLRRDLGESRRTIARFSMPLLPANTGSLEALKDYSQALRLSQRGEFPEAIALLKQAVTTDPNFAAAWLDLSTYSANIVNHQDDLRFLQRAYDLRATANEPVRLYIQARYAATVAENLYDSLHQFQAMAELYPRNLVAAAGEMQVAMQLGRYEEAAAAGRHALAINPNYVSIYYGLCSSLRNAGRIAEARQTCESAIAHHLDTDAVRAELFVLGRLQQDAALVAAQEQWSSAHPDAMYLKLRMASATVANGDTPGGLALLDEATAACDRAGLQSLAAAYRQHVALNLAFLGDLDRARHLIVPSEIDNDDGLPILALALTGHSAEASMRSHDQLRKKPDSTVWTDFFGPLTLAGVDLAEGRPDPALQKLTGSRLLENEGLELPLLRARALQTLHRDAEARDQYQFIVDHQFLDPTSSAITVAKKELGKSKIL